MRWVLAVFCLACGNGWATAGVHVFATATSLLVDTKAQQGIVEVTMRFENGSDDETVEPKAKITWFVADQLSNDVPLIGLDGTTSFDMRANETRTMDMIGAFVPNETFFDERLCNATVEVSGHPTTLICRF
jgi:hypothetical protein